MNEFSYQDIFQTKGVEYLIIIGFLILIIPFWTTLNRKRTALETVKSIGALTFDILRIPRGILFSRNHTWTFLGKSGLAEVGLDDWLAHLVGNVKLNFLKNEGEQIRKGDLLTEVVSDGKTLRIHSPISGKIMEINRKLAYNSEPMDSNPYREGWLFKMEPENWAVDTGAFMVGEKAASWFQNEIARLKDFMAETFAKNVPEAAVVFQEGGELRDHLLSEMPPEMWSDFQKEFLNQE